MKQKAFITALTGQNGSYLTHNAYGTLTGKIECNQ